MGSDGGATARLWGQKIVPEAPGWSGTTLRRGLVELGTAAEERVTQARIGNTGGGRKSKTTLDKTLNSDRSQIIEASTCGNPETPLLWTSKSTGAMADEL